MIGQRTTIHWSSEATYSSGLTKRRCLTGIQSLNAINGDAPISIIYSDVAIQTLLSVREVFHLSYRSLEGFGQSLFASGIYESLTKAVAKTVAFTNFTRKSSD